MNNRAKQEWSFFLGGVLALVLMLLAVNGLAYLHKKNAEQAKKNIEKKVNQ